MVSQCIYGDHQNNAAAIQCIIQTVIKYYKQVNWKCKLTLGSSYLASDTHTINF